MASNPKEPLFFSLSFFLCFLPWGARGRAKPSLCLPGLCPSPCHSAYTPQMTARDGGYGSGGNCYINKRLTSLRPDLKHNPFTSGPRQAALDTASAGQVADDWQMHAGGEQAGGSGKLFEQHKVSISYKFTTHHHTPPGLKYSKPHPLTTTQHTSTFPLLSHGVRGGGGVKE